MVSDQLTGATLRIYAVSPSDDKIKLFSGVNEQTGPGGSQDGVQATVKANELPIMPVNQTPIPGGWKLVVTGQMAAADGADASDSVFNIPVVEANGGLRYLTAADIGYTTDLPAASVAGVEHQLGAGYTVPQNQTLRLGGGTYFMSWENDA